MCNFSKKGLCYSQLACRCSIFAWDKFVPSVKSSFSDVMCTRVGFIYSFLVYSPVYLNLVSLIIALLKIVWNWWLKWLDILLFMLLFYWSSKETEKGYMECNVSRPWINSTVKLPLGSHSHFLVLCITYFEICKTWKLFQRFKNLSPNKLSIDLWDHDDVPDLHITYFIVKSLPLTLYFIALIFQKFYQRA